MSVVHEVKAFVTGWFVRTINNKVASDIAVGLGLLLLIELALPEHATLAAVTPHPFWVLVLLVTVQHGSRAGLAAAIVLTLAVLVWVHPEREALEDFYAYTSRIFLDPVLWIAAALILGQLRDRQTAANAALAFDVQSLKDDRYLLGKHCVALRRRVGNLERHISLADTKGADEALRRLASLREAPSELVLARLADAAQVLLGPCIMSVHQRIGARVLTETISCAGLRVEVPPRGSAHARVLISALEKARRPVSSLTPRGAALLNGGVIAVSLPLRGAGNRACVLCCEVLDESTATLGERSALVEAAMATLAAALAQALHRAHPLAHQRSASSREGSPEAGFSI